MSGHGPSLDAYYRQVSPQLLARVRLHRQGFGNRRLQRRQIRPLAQARVDHRRLDEIGAWPAAARQLLAGAQAVDGTGQVAQRSLGFGFGAVKGMIIIVLAFSVLMLFTIAFFIYSMFVILRHKQLSELQRDFINNMTHEFKTPISTINISTDVFLQNEIEQSTYNFEHSDVEFLLTAFAAHEGQSKYLMEQQLALPAYEQVLKAAHSFNLLDARGAISVTERAAYIGRIRNLARAVAQSYFESRERLGFPMAPREWVEQMTPLTKKAA